MIAWILYGVVRIRGFAKGALTGAGIVIGLLAVAVAGLLIAGAISR
jgi:hypothetical protein